MPTIGFDNNLYSYCTYRANSRKVRFAPSASPRTMVNSPRGITAPMHTVKLPYVTPELKTRATKTHPPGRSQLSPNPIPPRSEDQCPHLLGFLDKRLEHSPLPIQSVHVSDRRPHGRHNHSLPTPRSPRGTSAAAGTPIATPAHTCAKRMRQGQRLLSCYRRKNHTQKKTCVQQSQRRDMSDTCRTCIDWLTTQKLDTCDFTTFTGLS